MNDDSKKNPNVARPVTTLPRIDGDTIEEIPAADLDSCAGGALNHTCVQPTSCPATQPVCSQQGP